MSENRAISSTSGAKTDPDFFISRAGRDASFAASIGLILEEAGYRVVLQQWDFGNQSFMSAMDAALRSEARVIALLSPDYLASPHCAAEWQSALAADPNNERGRLIIFRITDCAPRGLLAPLSFIDLVPVREDPSSLKQVVLDALRQGRRGSLNGPSEQYRRWPSSGYPPFYQRRNIRILGIWLTVLCATGAAVYVVMSLNRPRSASFVLYDGLSVLDVGGQALSGSTIETCAAKCAADQTCNAFSFLVRNRACFLKPTYREVAKDDRVKSGIREGLPPPGAAN